MIGLNKFLFQLAFTQKGEYNTVYKIEIGSVVFIQLNFKYIANIIKHVFNIHNKATQACVISLS